MSEKYWRACSDEKLETPPMASPTLRTGTIGLFTSMFLNYCCPVNFKTAQESSPKPFRIGLRAFFFKKQAP